MKYVYSLFYCLIVLNVNAQQKLNIFHVVDSLSGKAIPAASITIVRAKLSINTEKDAIFSIPGDLTKMRDTVIVEAQGYLRHLLLLHKMHGMDSLKLNRSILQIAAVELGDKKEIELNMFRKYDVAYYAGLHTEMEEFSYLQLAQQFFLPKSGAQLVKVSVARLAFRINGQRQDFAVGMEPTKFRLRIYEDASNRSGPGAELCQQVIEVRDKDSQYIGINLSAYKIMIPGKSFFVAVEWMRDFTNQGFVIFEQAPKQSKKLINYIPAIGISPIKGSKQNIWGLNLKKQWKPYTYFAPDFTDLAITAVIRQ